jgi:hypothetical protein
VLVVVAGRRGGHVHCLRAHPRAAILLRSLRTIQRPLTISTSVLATKCCSAPASPWITQAHGFPSILSSTLVAGCGRGPSGGLFG